MKETSYINHPLDTRVRIKSTGQMGEAFELSKLLNAVSVFLEGEDKPSYFRLDDVEFIENKTTNEQLQQLKTNATD